MARKLIAELSTLLVIQFVVLTNLSNGQANDRSERACKNDLIINSEKLEEVKKFAELGDVSKLNALALHFMTLGDTEQSLQYLRKAAYLNTGELTERMYGTTLIKYAKTPEEKLEGLVMLAYSAGKEAAQAKDRLELTLSGDLGEILLSEKCRFRVPEHVADFFLHRYFNDVLFANIKASVKTNIPDACLPPSDTPSEKTNCIDP